MLPEIGTWLGLLAVACGVALIARSMVWSRQHLERVQMALVPSEAFSPTQQDLDSFHRRLMGASDRMTSNRLLANPSQRTIRFTYVRDDTGSVVSVLDLPAYAAMFFHGPILPGVENWPVDEVLYGESHEGVIPGMWGHGSKDESANQKIDRWTSNGVYVTSVLESLEPSFQGVAIEGEPTTEILLEDLK